MSTPLTGWRTVGAGLFAVGIIGLAALTWASNIRNLFGIRKDALETKKTKLELNRMEATIIAPTTGEVIAYDPKRQAIIKAAHGDLINYCLMVGMLILGVLLFLFPGLVERLQQEFQHIASSLK